MVKKSLAAKLAPLAFLIPFTGCDPNSQPSPFSVSSCGNNIVYNSMKGEDKGRVFGWQATRGGDIDTKTVIYNARDGEFRSYDNNSDAPALYSIGGQSFAYSVIEPTEDTDISSDEALGALQTASAGYSGDNANVYVVVRRPNESYDIKNAFFPVLCSNGEKLAYTHAFDGDFKGLKYFPLSPIRVKELESGESKDVGVGIPRDFSPDSSKLLFLQAPLVDIDLNYYDFEDGTRNRIFSFTPVSSEEDPESNTSSLEARILGPHFINNEQIIFSATLGESHKPEIYISDLNGNLQQVTDNDLIERYYGVDSRGRVLYTASEDGGVPYNLFVATRGPDGEWTSIDTQNQMLYMQTAGDNIIFMKEHFKPEREKPLPLLTRFFTREREMIPASGGEIFMTSVDNAIGDMNNDKIENISEIIGK